MRIPSVKKLKKQAEYYSDTHKVVMPKEWHDEYNLLEEQFFEARKPLDIIQEKCPAKWGNNKKCTCDQDPDHGIVTLKLGMIVDRKNRLWRERYLLQKAIYENELRELLKMREAKIEYLSSTE